MMNKKEKENVSKTKLPDKVNNLRIFTPFSNLRKSLRKLRPKKIKRSLSADSVATEAPINKVKPNSKQKNKLLLVEKNANTNKGNTVLQTENKNNNFLRRKLSSKRLHNNGSNLTGKYVASKHLSIIEWSSCESIPDNEKCKWTKNNSLRRSRASLVIPTDTEGTKLFISPSRRNHYSSMNHINQEKVDVCKNNRWNSVERLPTEPNRSEKSLHIGNNTKRKRCVSKDIGHSLSLPNINENNANELVEIEIMIDDCDEESSNLSPVLKLKKPARAPSPCNIALQETIKPVESKHLEETTLRHETYMKPKNKNKQMYASTPALARPPVPSAPKPVDRRNNHILRWSSTEALSGRNSKKYKEDKEKLTRTLSDLACPQTTKEQLAVLIPKLCDINYDLQKKFGKERRPNKCCQIHNPSLMKSPSAHLTETFLRQICPSASVAEGLWDHTGLNEDELTFVSGDVITVLFKEDDHWWWGHANDGQEGWFPAAYVRLRVVQEIDNDITPVQNDVISDIALNSSNRCVKRKSKEKLMTLRAKCVEELLNTERDYVKLLKNVIEGYLQKVREEKQLFSEDDTSIIFGNIEQLYELHKTLLHELQSVIKMECMENSSVGEVFLRNRSRFEIYSEYCNNQPRSSARLSSLGKNDGKKVTMFFERCRLRQSMIRLSLDGFLLSPVQKICKYPLQLKELLKHTENDHPDYTSLVNAKNCMQNVASLINERKRRLENVNKLARWQLTVSSWKGDDIVTKSSDLLHKGTLYKVTNTKRVERVLYLFDHQLIYFRYDPSKRQPLTYCGRVDLDSTIIDDITDDAFLDGNDTFKNGWKLWNCDKKKWYYFYTDCKEKKEAWLKAFQNERKHVEDEIKKGFTVPPEVRVVAMENAHTKHSAEMKKSRMRRKSIATSHASLDLEMSDGLSLKPKYDALQITSSSETQQNTVVKRSNKPKRSRSFRLSLQGGLFEKFNS